MIRLKCNNCGKMYSMPDADLEYECVDSSERQMGSEKEYEGRYEIACEKCENKIIVEFHFWEYPENALNYSEYQEEGCILLEEPDYQSYLSEGEDEGEDE